MEFELIVDNFAGGGIPELCGRKYTLMSEINELKEAL